MMPDDSIKILIIEDDATMRDGIEAVLSKDGYRVVTAATGEEGRTLFTAEQPDLVITDLKLPGPNGMILLEEFIGERQEVRVILISAFGTIDLAVEALKTGAYDFIAKPFSIDELRMKVNRVVEDLTKGKDQVSSHDTFHDMVGASHAIRALFEKIEQVAAVDSPVLITGESGTGKELVARALHKESSRHDNPFLAVNCGALTESLLESELFGHEKGAFTGAVQQHKGVFERAHTGTILLDEIGEISPRLQVKLLRVLQHQAFFRVGGNEEIQTDVRVLAATNKNLKEATGRGEFREDLYFRLNVIPLSIPPLRERPEDVPVLTRHISRQKARRLNRAVPDWSEPALRRLEDYSWPGNVRELENFLERLLIFHTQSRITADDLYFDEEMDRSDTPTGSLNDVLEQTEYTMILDALEKSGGIKQRAARILGINTSTLYYKLEKYGIDPDQESPAEPER